MINLQPMEIFSIILPTFAGFLIVDRITPIIAKFMLQKRITGVDIHKPNKPLIPEMCGLAVVVGLVASISIYAMLQPTRWIEAAALMGVIIIAAMIGLRDDIKSLSAGKKIILSATSCIPIIALEVYAPFLELPFIGIIRMTLIYPIAVIPLYITTFSNATNMMDVFNGVMPLMLIVGVAFMLPLTLLLGNLTVASLYAILLGCLLAFFRYNRHPAKVFSGDVGSLSLGALIGALAIVGRTEVLTLIVFLPMLVNGALNLSSVGRFFERRELSHRPIVLLEDGRLAASLNSRAPITLSRFLLIYGPLSEKDIVKQFGSLMMISGLLGVSLAIVMWAM